MTPMVYLLEKPRWCSVTAFLKLKCRCRSNSQSFFSANGFNVTVEPRLSSLVIRFSLCLDTRQPGTVVKKLDTRQSEILTNFLGIARLIPLKTEDICLEISSDCKYCLGKK